jgi:hypothetical protein
LDFDLLRLVGTHIVLGQDGLHRLQPVANDRLVIRGAVHAEQILQHIDRHIRPFLDQLGQILADDLAGEVPIQQGVDVAVEHVRNH